MCLIFFKTRFINRVQDLSPESPPYLPSHLVNHSFSQHPENLHIQLAFDVTIHKHNLCQPAAAQKHSLLVYMYVSQPQSACLIVSKGPPNSSKAASWRVIAVFSYL